LLQPPSDAPFVAMKMRSTALRAMSSIPTSSLPMRGANVVPSMADTVGSLESLEI